MNYKMLGRFISMILAIETVSMIPALLISVFLHETASLIGFLVAMAAGGVIAAILYVLTRGAGSDFYAREGMVCVGVSWIVLCLLGCIPFVVSGAIPNFLDALFETVSGFTTTGSTIVPRPSLLPKGILYWRSFSHWLGGMGVLVFLLALIPVSGRNEGYTLHILRAESPGPSVGKLVPKMRQTAKVLYLIYIALTALNILFLLLGGMSLFDAVCTAFGTAGTGGFGTRDSSIADFSAYIQIVCTVFMLLFGVNFSVFYLVLLRRVRSVFKDEELRFYLLTVFGSVGLVVWNLLRHGVYGTVGETIRHAFFQVASIITTTGFSTTDYEALWPSFSKALLLILMVIGACAGSTGGGLKCSRVVMLLKVMKRNIAEVMHPQKIKTVRLSGKPVSEKILANTNAYFATYIFIAVASYTVVSLASPYGLTENLSAVLACFNNVGPGLGEIGPAANFAGIGAVSKGVLIVDMLAGRLEIFPIIVLFSRQAWKRG
ncbi:MAG: TrkH family potassium uptake protein [Clostridia bacterium]|nr:TrkH family potassium uptake protein [Clostridia bacterium]